MHRFLPLFAISLLLAACSGDLQQQVANNDTPQQSRSLPTPTNTEADEQAINTPADGSNTAFVRGVVVGSGASIAALLVAMVLVRRRAVAPASTPASLSPVEVSTHQGPSSPNASRLGADSANDLLNNAPWLKLVEESVDLFDELDRYRDGLALPAKELADHMSAKLTEMLQRANVTIIADETRFDRQRHQSEPAGVQVQANAPIAETLSPGFAVGRRVLRRARVRLITSVPTTGVQP